MIASHVRAHRTIWSTCTQSQSWPSRKYLNQNSQMLFCYIITLKLYIFLNISLGWRGPSRFGGPRSAPSAPMPKCATGSLVKRKILNFNYP